MSTALLNHMLFPTRYFLEFYSPTTHRLGAPHFPDRKSFLGTLLSWMFAPEFL